MEVEIQLYAKLKKIATIFLSIFVYIEIGSIFMTKLYIDSAKLARKLTLYSIPPIVANTEPFAYLHAIRSITFEIFHIFFCTTFYFISKSVGAKIAWFMAFIETKQNNWTIFKHKPFFDGLNELNLNFHTKRANEREKKE